MKPCRLRLSLETRYRSTQTHHRLGGGEQPQTADERPLRQGEATQGRPRLQAGLQGVQEPEIWFKESEDQDPRRLRPNTHPRRNGSQHTPPGGGYGSGLIATKVPEWGEFVLAQMTQTFDKGDVTYFHPLMEGTELNLGCKPRCAALDAAFDAPTIISIRLVDSQPSHCTIQAIPAPSTNREHFSVMPVSPLRSKALP